MTEPSVEECLAWLEREIPDWTDDDYPPWDGGMIYAVALPAIRDHLRRLSARVAELESPELAALMEKARKTIRSDGAEETWSGTWAALEKAALAYARKEKTDDRG